MKVGGGQKYRGPDEIMLHILDLHSQGYNLVEACAEADVPEHYWNIHRRTFLDALAALNVAHAVRQALNRRLIRERVLS